MQTCRGVFLHRNWIRVVAISSPVCCLGCGPQLIDSGPVMAPPAYQVQPAPATGLMPSQTSGTASLSDLPQMPASSMMNLPRRETEQRYHEVQSGETLTSLAAKYATTATALRSANGLDSSAALQPGQLLWIPMP